MKRKFNVNSKYLQKRDEIKRISKMIFLRYGYEKTTFHEIAQAVGLKLNSLYYYFSDKETLFNEVIDTEYKIFYKRLTNCIDRAKSPQRKIILLFEELLFVDRWKEHCRQDKISECVELTRLIYSVLIKEKASITNSLMGILDEGIRMGYFVDHNTALLSETLFDFIFAFFRESIVEPALLSELEWKQDRLEEKITLIVCLISRAISVDNDNQRLLKDNVMSSFK